MNDILNHLPIVANVRLCIIESAIFKFETKIQYYSKIVTHTPKKPIKFKSP